MKKAVLILSGGVDSSTLLYWLKANGYDDVLCVTFNYAQKHIIELNSAALIAKKSGASHKIVDISFIKDFLAKSSSSVTNSNIAVPHGEYSKENMSSTVVPNRNAMLLTIAWTIACVENADAVAYGAHSGDHYLYPDTRVDFFNAINLSLRLGSEGDRQEKLSLIAPFIDWDKTQIIKMGAKLNVPFELTYSCYEGGEMHCGLCGACSERKQSFIAAQVSDPTRYKNEK